MSEGKEKAVDISSVRTLDQIREAFELLKENEESTDRELQTLLSSHRFIEAELKELLQSGQLQIGKVQNEAMDMTKNITFTASLADGVSAKVKQLDLAKGRVSDCQQRVNDLIDLRLCADGVKHALNDENYEKAAAHLHRFLAMDEKQLKVTAQRMNEGNGQGLVSLDGALATLHDGKDRVRRVVSQRFDEAVQNDDLASIERFFKLFPLINMHEGGLERFSKYMSTKIATTSQQNLSGALNTMPGDTRSSVIFADTLTLLFEGIARTVEIHQPLIETYYGPGRLTTVLFMLQKECDKQAAQIFHEFRKKRHVSDKVEKVRDSIYGSASLSSASMTGSFNESAPKLEAREVDHVLEEMALLQARSEMYFKFVKIKSMGDIDAASTDKEQSAVKKQAVERDLLQTGLCQSTQELMSEYVLFEEFYMTQNIRKAVQHQHDSSNDMTDDKLLDDVFFIIKQCLSRAAGCGNLDGFCAVTNNACSILDTEFASVLLSQLKMGFPSGYLDMTMNVIQTSLHHGYRKAAAQATGDSERQKTVFLSAFNCAENSMDYIARLRSRMQQDTFTLVSGKSQHEKDKLENSLSGFSNLSDRFQAITDQGMQMLRQSVIKPRIKPWVDTFPNHDITENTFADYEANDPFVQTFIMNLDGLLSSFKGSLTTNNYETFVSMIASEVTLQIEKAALKSKFSRLGGLQFDREIRSLVSFFANWSMREKFSRLNQIATILNLEAVNEVNDFQENWKLTTSEIKQILSLRVDFRPDEVKKVRL